MTSWKERGVISMVRKTNWCWAVAVCLLFSGATIWAQEAGDKMEDESTAYEGIIVGNGILRPSFELLLEHDDNIFLTATNKIDDLIYLVRPGIEYEVPFNQSSFKVGAVLQYKDFQDYQFDDNLSPLGSFDLLLKFSNGLTLNLADRYISGVLEVDEIDPDAELLFGKERFRKNGGRFSLRYDFTTRDGIGISADVTDLSFDNSTSLFYDYTKTGAAISYFHLLHPLVELNVTAKYLDLSHNSAESFRDATGSEAWIGLKGELTQTLSGSARIGFRSLAYDDNEFSGEDFSGLVAEANLSQKLANQATLDLLLHRSSNQSNFAPDVNFYTATRGGLEYHQRIDKLFFSLGGFYQVNDYPNESLLLGLGSRNDKLLRARLSIGYYFMPTLSLRANYRYDDKDSNLDTYDYTSNAFLVDLRWGY